MRNHVRKNSGVVAADRVFTQAVARGDVKAVAIFGHGTPKDAISDEAGAEATQYGITRVWVKRDGLWAETLNSQTAIRPSAATTR